MGNVDIGLISLISAHTLASVGHYVPVPQTTYQPIMQGAVALKDGAALLEFLHPARVAKPLEQGGLTPIQ